MARPGRIEIPAILAVSFALENDGLVEMLLLPNPLDLPTLPLDLASATAAPTNSNISSNTKIIFSLIVSPFRVLLMLSVT